MMLRLSFCSTVKRAFSGQPCGFPNFRDFRHIYNLGQNGWKINTILSTRFFEIKLGKWHILVFAPLHPRFREKLFCPRL